MAQQASQRTDSCNNSQAPHQHSSLPSIRTDNCLLKNFQITTVAVGKVFSAAPGSTTEMPAVEVILEDIADRSAPLPDGSGATLGDLTPGEIVVWPSYFVIYLSTS